MSGPLDGVRLIEVAGLGPGPMAAMMLAGMGAAVVRVDRIDPGVPLMPVEPRYEPTLRGRLRIAVDLKQPEGVEVLLALVAGADGLMEGFRPGVAERLGFGPDVCLARNPRLVFGRMTGYGQSGPLAGVAGHDINYIAQTGALHAVGPAEAPVPPLNLVGDYGGGAMLLAFGMVCALLERERSGLGQVVDAAMVDGAALLMTPFYGLVQAGTWSDRRASNLLDGGCPFYGVYATRDGRHMAVGALEAKFFADLVARLGLDPTLPSRQHDRAAWPAMREALASAFLGQDFRTWCEALEGHDCCVSGVRTIAEAAVTDHARARRAFETVDGVSAPVPAPRFSRSGDGRPRAATAAASDTDMVLDRAGYSTERISRLRKSGVVS